MRRVVEQITGDPGRFGGHQEQIDNYRNRLKDLKRDWKDNDCDDPTDPPFGTTQWIKQTDSKVLDKYNKTYHQYVESIKTGALVAAASLLEELAAYFVALGEVMPVFVP